MQGPADIVLAEVVGAVSCVPGVCAAGPGQLRREGGDEVVKSPSHDGVVVGGYVKIYDTDGKANSWRGRKELHFRGKKKKKEKRNWSSHQLVTVYGSSAGGTHTLPSVCSTGISCDFRNTLIPAKHP